MLNRPIAALAAAALLLGAPSVAMAQSAGDNQYQDPLGGGGGGNSGSSSGGGQSGTSTPAPAPAKPAQSPAPVGNSARPAAAKPELPRTGTEPLLVALVGSALLLAGGGLRLAVPRRES